MSDRHSAIGVFACVGGLMALAGTFYALFGPLVIVGGPDGGETLSHYEHGLSAGGWMIFAGLALSSIGTIIGGGLLAFMRHSSTSAYVLGTSGILLNALAGFSALTVGWVVLPGALIVLIAVSIWLYAATEAT